MAPASQGHPGAHVLAQPQPVPALRNMPGAWSWGFSSLMAALLLARARTGPGWGGGHYFIAARVVVISYLGLKQC